MNRRRLPRPAAIYLLAVGLLALVTGLAVGLHGPGEAALASLTRQTARVAFLFFFVAFTASVWFTWRVTPWTRWLMQRRRHIGLSFALLHAVHLSALAGLFAVRGERPDVVTAAGGGLAYLALLALVVTSNRAARIRLGRRWRALHLTGCWYLWLIFAQSYLGRLAPDARAQPYALFVLLTALALAVPPLRLWAWLRRRARRPAVRAGPDVVSPGAR